MLENVIQIKSGKCWCECKNWKEYLCIKKDTSWKMLRLIKMNTNNQLKKKILKMVHVII